MSVADFAQALQAYCSRFRGSITSWGRTPKRNASVGGVATSYHLLFLGADVVYDDEPPDPVEATRTAQQLGLKLVREDDHDHMQPL